MAEDILANDMTTEQYVDEINALKSAIEQPFADAVRWFSEFGYDKEPAIKNLLNVAHTLESVTSNTQLVERIKRAANSHRVNIMRPEKLPVGIEEAFDGAAYVLQVFAVAHNKDKQDPVIASLQKAADSKYLIAYIQKTLLQSRAPVLA